MVHDVLCIESVTPMPKSTLMQTGPASKNSMFPLPSHSVGRLNKLTRNLFLVVSYFFVLILT